MSASQGFWGRPQKQEMIFDLNFEISVVFVIVDLEGSMWFQGQETRMNGWNLMQISAAS